MDKKTTTALGVCIAAVGGIYLYIQSKIERWDFSDREFDGVKDYIELKKGKSFQDGQEWSWESWFNFGENPQTHYGLFSGRGGSTPVFFLTSSRARLFFYPALYEGKTLYWDYFTPPIAPNTWYHFAVICDGKSFKLYRNKVQHPAIITPYDGKTEFNFGRLGVFWDNFLKGKIGKGKIHEKALSLEELERIFTPQAARYGY